MRDRINRILDDNQEHSMESIAAGIIKGLTNDPYFNAENVRVFLRHYEDIYKELIEMVRWNLITYCHGNRTYRKKKNESQFDCCNQQGKCDRDERIYSVEA